MSQKPSQKSPTTPLLCQTMRSRIDDINHKKLIKQKIYDEITSKYGKKEKIQKELLKLYQNGLDEHYDLRTIEKKIQKNLQITENTEKTRSQTEIKNIQDFDAKTTKNQQISHDY